jgi:drug/metabolite transporter, DME family
MREAGRSSKYLWGIACISLATLGWSLSGLFVRWLPDLDGWVVNGYRAPATAATLLVYLIIRYRGGVWRHLWPRHPRGLLVVACFFSVGSTLYVYALTKGTVASVSVLGATSPLFAAMLAWLVMRERTSVVSIGATIIALIGVGIVVRAETSAMTTGILSSMIALGYAFCFAGQSVTLRHYRDYEMIPGIVLGGFLVFLFVVLFVGLPLLPWREAGLLALMGVLQLGLPLILYAIGAKHVPVVPLLLISIGDVVLNPFWVWLVHGEEPPAGSIAGGALILSAIIGATLYENGRQRVRV